MGTCFTPEMSHEKSYTKKRVADNAKGLQLYSPTMQSASEISSVNTAPAASYSGIV